MFIVSINSILIDKLQLFTENTKIKLHVCIYLYKLPRDSSMDMEYNNFYDH